MIINGKRALAYTVVVDSVEPIEGADRIELAMVGGWSVVVKKDEFSAGDVGVFFEIDSKVPESDKRFEFLANKNYKIKTMKLGKFGVYSQGLLLPLSQFPEVDSRIGVDCTEKLGVTYIIAEDNERKATSNKKHTKIYNNPLIRPFMRYEWFRKIIFSLLKENNESEDFPTHLRYIKVTDQERCENLKYKLKDKTPYIRTEKCDGSSATYIAEKIGRNKFKFYVCSRNKCYMQRTDNIYWKMADKYNIKDHLIDYIKDYGIRYVCWQGEICAPKIQGNPHKLKEPHLYLFHMIDSTIGKYDLRLAVKVWDHYNMEHVPIVDLDYVMPDDFEELKLSADGYYDESVCEGQSDCPREGFVYYNTENPNDSFKNVSRKYLLKHDKKMEKLNAEK